MQEASGCNHLQSHLFDSSMQSAHNMIYHSVHNIYRGLHMIFHSISSILFYPSIHLHLVLQ